ncbi:MAG: aminomethyl-transferring glycine dehydrogenase subunit GcvPA [Desulfofustis sp.]|nr:aminomethyl-transferring glycine dehydrogenase subunit GcvPA [Desulfofustis sp.]MBT8353319.1 aminomethyl-transferring glycine dehydrogenase subunit GcvPA [Desulfofustis sp.]NNK58037.1 aminomethyl-transferring glycine dehydrogenase subunit GcvPA [Desulfofustis sp.]RZW25395.1 MAG: aminomethyl-transferring glycine dehydrogenase subunit GcvPA [Desulfobulbaceae bacterium]
MRYLPHTQEEIAEMLAVTGQQSLEELFDHIPEDLRYQGEIDIPGPLSEWELTDHFENLGSSMYTGSSRAVLIGAGSYDHHVPEIVRSLSGRSEFLTSYTPYQPEMAQGTLQGIFEFQTLTARLLGTEVANASMYDGASALAEALLMAIRISKKKRTVAISSAVHPHYREVVRTYLAPGPFEIVELPYGADGRTELSVLAEIDDLAGVALQSPNFFGVIEDHAAAAELVHDRGALYIACFSEPLTFGLYRNPGSFGADIVCGEGQSFGMNQSYGGAGLGMFGCKQQFVRNMPGRVVGRTADKDGKRGFVLTLATREQHIRREKATSNICSNQGLCAMTAAIHMATLGSTGLRELAKLNYDKAAHLRNGLLDAGATQLFSGPVFNEFVVVFDTDFRPQRERLLHKGIVAGLPLTGYYPDLGQAYLFCATETVSRQLIDELLEEVRR